MDSIKGTGTTKRKQTISRLQEGTMMQKIRSGGKRHRRFYFMDKECVSIMYSKAHNKRKAKIAVKVTEIQDIRIGPSSDVFVKYFKKLGVDKDYCFSVVTGSRFKTLDLIATSKAMRDDWVWALKHLKKRYHDADLSTQQDVYMRELFKFADKNNDQALGMREITSLLKHMNIEISHREAKETFLAADTDKQNNHKGTAQLDIDEFIEFYRLITKRKELEELFHKYTEGSSYMDQYELQKFLEIEQSENLSDEECLQLIKKYEPFPHLNEQGQLCTDGFHTLMNAPMLDIFNHNHTHVYQDMSRPLQHYYIDSSHNTYLTADQLIGDSAVEAYIRALKRGCRCVELDCWDSPDGDDGQPVIYHGYTLTSKILIIDTLTAINKYAFDASPYPVILSIENHLSVDQQQVLARQMKEVFGDKLYTIPDGTVLDDLPSPEQLKGRILVKAKKLKSTGDQEGEVSDEDEAAEIEQSDNSKNKNGAAGQQEVQRTKKKSSGKVKMCKELSDIVAICQSVSFKGFDYAKNNYNCMQMSSFGESKAMGLAKDEPQAYINHNQFQLSRTYPSGARTDSSNYDPEPLWNTGCQVVALNYQTSDNAMTVYKGKFRDNGGCGYILKPAFLLKDPTPFNPDGPFNPEWKRTLTLKIISGYQFPKQKGRDILDPYVKVYITGVEQDKQSARTHHIENNGFNPVWNKELEFEVSVPDLAVVTFHVMDHDTMSANDLVAQTAMPFNSIKPGYRTVHMNTKHGAAIWGCSVLVHVTIN